jgi:hypothetical protein
LIGERISGKAGRRVGSVWDIPVFRRRFVTSGMAMLGGDVCEVWVGRCGIEKQDVYMYPSSVSCGCIMPVDSGMSYLRSRWIGFIGRTMPIGFPRNRSAVV